MWGGGLHPYLGFFVIAWLLAVSELLALKLLIDYLKRFTKHLLQNRKREIHADFQLGPAFIIFPHPISVNVIIFSPNIPLYARSCARYDRGNLDCKDNIFHTYLLVIQKVPEAHLGLRIKSGNVLLAPPSILHIRNPSSIFWGQVTLQIPTKATWSHAFSNA